MRIAVCDDEKPYREAVTGLVQSYIQTKPEQSFTLFSFSSGKELINYVDENGSFDLYILDVIMPNMNGLQLASRLRSRKDNGMIIYLCSSPDFAVDSYNVAAFYYLLKPIGEQQFFQIMDKAVASFCQTEQDVVLIKTPRSSRAIPARNIRCAARAGRCVCYELTDGTTIESVTFNDKFQNAVASLLNHNGMLLIGSSYVVNLYYVEEITKSDLLLSGGHRIRIPRNAYESVKSEWADFWLNGGNNHAF